MKTAKRLKSGILVVSFFLSAFGNTILAIATEDKPTKDCVEKYCEQRYNDCIDEVADDLINAFTELRNAYKSANAEYDLCIRTGIDVYTCKRAREAKKDAATENWVNKRDDALNRLNYGCAKERQDCLDKNQGTEDLDCE